LDFMLSTYFLSKLGYLFIYIKTYIDFGVPVDEKQESVYSIGNFRTFKVKNVRTGGAYMWNFPSKFLDEI